MSTRVLAVFLTASALTAQDAEPAPKPNIVFVMADDLGYGDLRCYNGESKIPTPNLDRLAGEGMRFTDAHAPAALCVQTRYGLLTGRYPLRMPRRRGPLIDPDRMTIGSLLQDNGYRTACVGKWHLGFDGEKDPAPDVALSGGPTDRGFHEYYGIPASLDIPPYYWIDGDRAVALPTETVAASSTPGVSPIQGAFWREGKVAPGFEFDAVLPTLGEKAVSFLRTCHERDAKQPFFLYLALTAPHTPWLPGEAFRGKSAAGMYGDFVMQVDAVVGDLLAALDDLELAANTLVIFTSDNGPVWYDADAERYGHRSVGPLRGMKGDAWEGGHRMPFVARWPARIEAGTTCDDVICHCDMLATFAALVGVRLGEDSGPDSYDISPLLFGTKIDRPLREATVFQSASRALAIRQGNWKLIEGLGSGGFSKPRKVASDPDGPQGQLYDLRADLGETRNAWSDEPEVVARLTRLLEEYRSGPSRRDD